MNINVHVWPYKDKKNGVNKTAGTATLLFVHKLIHSQFTERVSNDTNLIHRNRVPSFLQLEVYKFV